MKNSNIEWCDHTFNPWEGCTKVSPGCAHCYAETRNARFGGGTAANWGKGSPRRRTSVKNWNEPSKWDAQAKKAAEVYDSEPSYFHLGEPRPPRPRVFCASLADWLDDEVPIEWLADLLDLIRRTPKLDWLLLTKRPQNWRGRLEEVCEIDGDSLAWSWLRGNAPANVWIGTTVEDQQRADERIPKLIQIPARVRFLSCEPLLGPVDLTTIKAPHEDIVDALRGYAFHDVIDHVKQPGKVDWVICGGESGQHARPMHPNWARSLRDQCAAAGVPFFFKQWGENIPWEWDYQEFNNVIRSQHGEELFHDDAPRDPLNLPKGWDCFWFDGPEPDCTLCQRVGKAAAGRFLDGIEHNEFPEAQS